MIMIGDDRVSPNPQNYPTLTARFQSLRSLSSENKNLNCTSLPNKEIHKDIHNDSKKVSYLNEIIHGFCD